MAVYERTYKRYAGRLTALETRFLVLPRYALRDVFQSKIFVAFFAFSFTFPLLCAAWIYLRNNLDLVQALGIDLNQVMPIDERFFDRLMSIQLWFAFFVALFVGPGLVSRDLANNALPLYLSRPFSRAGYVLGKFSVLAILLSPMTWVAGLGLVALQANYAGWEWVREHWRIAPALFAGSWLWISLLALLALALSAWVRWRPVAGFMMFLVLLAGGFFGGLVNALFRVEWGSLLNLVVVFETVWDGLLGFAPGEGISVLAAWLALAVWSFVCLYLLHRKIRAYEVVS